jgi:hypothetical protein
MSGSVNLGDELIPAALNKSTPHAHIRIKVDFVRENHLQNK